MYRAKFSFHRVGSQGALPPSPSASSGVGSLDFETDERHIIAPWRAAAECIETEAQCAKAFADPTARLRDGLDHPIQPEDLSLNTERFEHAIGVEDETVAS
jgi:hypothetical protein